MNPKGLNKDVVATIASVFTATPTALAVHVTNDDQVFLTTPVATTFMLTHCVSRGAKHIELTRNEFETLYPDAMKAELVAHKIAPADNTEKVAEKADLNKTNTLTTSPQAAAADPLAWRKLKYGELKEYAQSVLGFTATTPPGKGAKGLLAEIDAFLATRPAAPAEESAEDDKESEATDAEKAAAAEDDSHNPVNA